MTSKRWIELCVKAWVTVQRRCGNLERVVVARGGAVVQLLHSGTRFGVVKVMSRWWIELCCKAWGSVLGFKKDAAT